MHKSRDGPIASSTFFSHLFILRASVDDAVRIKGASSPRLWGAAVPSRSLLSGSTNCGRYDHQGLSWREALRRRNPGRWGSWIFTPSTTVERKKNKGRRRKRLPLAILGGTKSISDISPVHDGPKLAVRSVKRKLSPCLPPFDFINRRCKCVGSALTDEGDKGYEYPGNCALS